MKDTTIIGTAKQDAVRDAIIARVRARYGRRQANRAKWVGDRMRQVGAVGIAKRRLAAELAQSTNATPTDTVNV